MSLSRSSISRVIWQPTGHMGQTDVAVFAALLHLYFRSTSAPVGHTSMQAPQNSQPDSSSDVPLEVPISPLPALSVKVRTLSPLTSSHTLTHLPQTMHRFRSMSHIGSATRRGICRLL